MKLPIELADQIKILELLGDGNTALVFKALFKYNIFLFKFKFLFV